MLSPTTALTMPTASTRERRSLPRQTRYPARARMVSSGTGRPTLPSTTTTKMARYPQCPTNSWRPLTKPRGRGNSLAGAPAGDDAHAAVLLEERVADVLQRDDAVV